MIILISNDTNKNYNNINDSASDRRWLAIAIILTRIGRHIGTDFLTNLVCRFNLQ